MLKNVSRNKTRFSFCLAAAAGVLSGQVIHAQTKASETKVYEQTVEVAPSQVGTEPAERSRPKTEDLFRAGPIPQWIWGPENDGHYELSVSWDGTYQSAWIKASCDNIMTLKINGQVVGSSSDWQTPVTIDISKRLTSGKNILTADVKNAGGIAAFLCKIALTDANGKTTYLVSDQSWQAKLAGKPDQQVALVAKGKLGVGPWNDVFSHDPSLDSGVPRETFVLLPGFQVEKLFTVPKEELGSWVCLTKDPRGRLLASDQGDKGICRIVPAPLGTKHGKGNQTTTRVEKLNLNITSAQGMLHAFGYLYLSVNGGPGSGLYRAKYLPETDTYGPVEKLKAFRGGGEHGPHALRLSPDGKSIFVIAGNHTDPPFSPQEAKSPHNSSRPSTNWGEDLLLPRMWDANGHARGRLAPGGWIARTDPDGQTWEIFSIGYRNAYDMAFNADGELFAYDADMEWDMGSPWYRPTRVVHATSGSEFGWRSGTGKWPIYYLDSLPPLINIGPGSPVGIEFGYGTKFPARYQKALFLCDWTFGTMYAVHIRPHLSSYAATKEEFLSRTPLPLTDATVGSDGALYFTIGGRGTQSELFRVTYVGEEPTAPANLHDAQFADHRATRNRVEKLHEDAALASIPAEQLQKKLCEIKALATGEDRFLQYAITVAFEHVFDQLPPSKEKIRFSGRSLPAHHLDSAAVILSHLDARDARSELLAGLWEDDLSRRSASGQLDYLRALSLVFLRFGEPTDEERARFAAKLDPLYPVPNGTERSHDLNRELCQMLVYLNSPTVVEKTVALLQEPSGQQENDLGALLARNRNYGSAIKKTIENQPDKPRIWYAFCLRVAKTGWTSDLRRKYFEFMRLAHSWSGGNSYQKFLTNIENEMFHGMPNSDQILIEAAGLRNAYQAPELPKPNGPGKEYTVQDILQLAETGLQPRTRNFKNGRKMFQAARCVICHRFGGEGGSTGPDLTQLAGRFNLKDLTEAIVDPTKVVSDQYKASTIVTANGESYTGRILSETDQQVSILTDPEDSTKVVDIPADHIEIIKPSDLSLMPAGLLKTLNEEEVLDLLAYLISRGNPNESLFQRK